MKKTAIIYSFNTKKTGKVAERIREAFGENQVEMVNAEDLSEEVFIEVKAEKYIKSLKIDGLYFVDESMRVYPNRELASHTLGFVNMNGDGGAGIELQYDRELKGK